jgi:tRNA A37 methylthiotransferase MiaB
MDYKIIKSTLFIMLLIAGNTGLAEDKKMASEIIVGFAKNTDQAQITSFEKKFKLTAIKKFKRVFAIRYKIPTGGDCKKTINKVQQEKIVRYAELNGKIPKKI